MRPWSGTRKASPQVPARRHGKVWPDSAFLKRAAEHAGIMLPYDAGAFAGATFNPFDIEDCYSAAMIVDQAFFLEACGDPRNARSLNPDHLRQKILGQR